MKNHLTPFLTWAAARGITTPLELVASRIDSPSRFMALPDSKKDEILSEARSSSDQPVDLLRVPLDACIVSDTSHGLAQKLSFEKERGQDSEFADWINILPSLSDFHMLPRFWDPDRRYFVKKYDGGQLESRLRFDQVRLDQTEDQWALACVDSRCNVLPGSKVCLAPMLDMFNHDSTVTTSARVVEEASCLLLSISPQSLLASSSKAMHSQNQGEICISYGDLTNLETLYNYGFVAASNECNVETFYVGLLGQKPLPFVVDSAGSIDNIFNQASFSTLFLNIATTFEVESSSHMPRISKRDEMEAYAFICGELEEASYQSKCGTKEAEERKDALVATYLSERSITLDAATARLRQKFPELFSL